MQLKTEGRIEILGKLPVSLDERLLHALDSKGKAGDRTLEILRELNSIFIRNETAVTVMHLIVDATSSPKPKITLELTLPDLPAHKFMTKEPTKLEDLQISSRVLNGLARNGINTLEKLCGFTEKEARSFRQIGANGITELKELLNQLGLSFK